MAQINDSEVFVCFCQFLGKKYYQRQVHGFKTSHQVFLKYFMLYFYIRIFYYTVCYSIQKHMWLYFKFSISKMSKNSWGFSNIPPPGQFWKSLIPVKPSTEQKNIKTNGFSVSGHFFEIRKLFMVGCQTHNVSTLTLPPMYSSPFAYHSPVCWYVGLLYIYTHMYIFYIYMYM